MNLTEEELQLLKQYRLLSTKKLVWLNRLAVEIVPPMVFVGVGIYRDEYIWFVMVVAVLVIFNIMRVVRQPKTLRLLASISKKILNAQD